MATSSIPRVKARLVERLDAAEWSGDRPQITYGWPRDEQRELVCIGGTIESEQRWVALGGRQRDEDYGLQVIVTVRRPGLSQTQATDRAFVLLGVIEDVLRADPTLGLDELFAVEVAQPRLAEAPDVEGFIAQVVTAVRVRARI